MKKSNLSLSVYINAIVFLLCLTFFISCEKETESSEKIISSFQFEAFDPDVVAAIDNATGNITATLPYDADVTSLIPTISVSPNAEVNPASGVVNDFTGSVIYTVTAEDGSTATYTVTVSLQAAPVEDPLTLSGSMSENRILEDRNDGIDYIIEGSFFVEGNALLTVEPGVKIAFTGVDGQIVVGENAGLKMQGTAEKNIILTGPVNNPSKGAWKGVDYGSSRSDNLMEYVQILNAGAGENEAVWIRSSAKVSIRNCRIAGSEAIGIYQEGSFIEFKNNVIEECEKYPIYVENLNQTTLFDSTSIFINNTEPYIFIDGYTDITNDIVINPLDVPYFINRTIIISKSLTIKPGVEFLVNFDGYISVSESGKLVAEGKPERQILFTGVEKESGYWIGINFHSKLSNTLKNCIIEYAGNDFNEAIIYLEYAKLNIEDCTLRNSMNYGVYYGYDATITHSNVSFDNCGTGNVYLWDTDEVVTQLP